VFLQNPAFEIVTPKFLNSLNTSGTPDHKMKLKVGTPIMLLRIWHKKTGFAMVLDLLAQDLVLISLKQRLFPRKTSVIKHIFQG